MSIRVLWWAMNTRRVHSCTCRCVLMALADATPDDLGRHAFPSARNISTRLSISLRTVQRELSWLESNGVIRRGDQSFVSRYPAQTRPIVWDLDVTGPEPEGEVELDDDRKPASKPASKAKKKAPAKGKETSQKSDTSNCRSSDSDTTNCRSGVSADTSESRSSYDTGVVETKHNNPLNIPPSPPKGRLPPSEKIQSGGEAPVDAFGSEPFGGEPFGGSSDGRSLTGNPFARDAGFADAGAGFADAVSGFADDGGVVDAADDREDRWFIEQLETLGNPRGSKAPGTAKEATAGRAASATAGQQPAGERLVRATRRLVSEHHALIGRRGLAPRTWPRRETANASWLISTLVDDGLDPDEAVDGILSAVNWALGHDYHRSRVLTLRTLASDWGALRQDMSSPRACRGQGAAAIPQAVIPKSIPNSQPSLAASLAAHRKLTRSYPEGRAVYWGEQWLESANLTALHQHFYDMVEPEDCPVCASDPKNAEHHADMARLQAAQREREGER